jgi:GNAT superfamily N-acetyltransferase
MEEKVDQFRYKLGSDCKMYKLSPDILEHCTRFDCGAEDLNDFFANDAIAYEKDLMGKTYCWLDDADNSKIVAMVTLANAGIHTTHLQNNSKRNINKKVAYPKRGRTYPAVLIGRLGVSTNYQGKDFKLGAQIMEFIKNWFRSVNNKTGCRFVVVDAVNEAHAIAYYERNGFKPLFPKVENEKEFYGIEDREELHTRMYYFDLL